MRTLFALLAFIIGLGSAYSLGAAGQPEGKNEEKKAIVPPRPAWADPPDYSAFPELRVSKLEDVEKIYAQLKANYPRPTPANASPLEKVQTAQVNHGVAVLLQFRSMVDAGAYRPEEMKHILDIASRTFRIEAEIMTTSAAKLAAAETRVRILSDVERFTAARVQAGAEHPRQLHQVRFERLQAEADLLLLKEQIAKEKTK